MFDSKGDMVPVTVVEVGPCTVVQRKTKETDGYDALQIGYGRAKAKNTTKPMRGHFEKKGLPVFSCVKEFRTDKAAEFNAGEELLVTGFRAGDVVDVTGRSKGRGFQGVMKRHGKHGGPASHGSDFHRRPGSIGMRAWPGRVLKNTRMPGHMGNDRVTTKHLTVMAVRPEDNALLLMGAVPGTREGVVELIPSNWLLEDRKELRRGAPKAEGGGAEETTKGTNKKETKHEETKG
jgi:large subunit ribosomal protein L3